MTAREAWWERVVRAMPPPDVRFYECGHSTAEHDPETVCNRRRDYDRLEQERLDKYGPCPSCEYGLRMNCNHPAAVARVVGL